MLHYGANKVSYIGVTESWTGCHVSDMELALNSYDLFRQDRPVDRDDGGVLLYVSSTLNAVQYRPTLATQFPEQIWCYFVDSKGCRFYVGVCYRTPSSPSMCIVLGIMTYSEKLLEKWVIR